MLDAGPVGESGTAGAAGVVAVGVEGVVASETVVVSSSSGVAGGSISVTLFAEIFPPFSVSPRDFSFFVLVTEFRSLAIK